MMKIERLLVAAVLLAASASASAQSQTPIGPQASNDDGASSLSVSALLQKAREESAGAQNVAGAALSIGSSKLQEQISAPGAAPVCSDGKAHTIRLSLNRDRLLGTLAARKHTDICTLWGSLNKGERTIFEMVTAYFGSCQSRLTPQGSSQEATALDFATTLYSINAPGVGTDSKCGGMDANRIYLAFDGPNNPAMRSMRGVQPAQNKWEASDDMAGAHRPFTDRDMIDWKSMPLGNSEGPQWHFFRTESDLNADRQAALSRRPGVCGFNHPNIVEATIAFSFDHDSNPLCNDGWIKKIAKKSGDPEWDYAPVGCSQSEPAGSEVNEGGAHNGLGASLINGSCEMAELQLPKTASRR
jgi:hypothetical protein